MGKGEATRQRMVEAASALLERQGYAATGLKQILEKSGTPRGSLYFHFPGGKEELALAVIERHRERFAQGIEQATRAAPSALHAATLLVEGLADDVATRDCALGCPVAAVTFEMAERSPALRRAAAATFDRWSALLASVLVEEGVTAAEARARSRSVLSAIEGALVLCRAYGNRGPLDDVRKVLPRLLG